MKLSLPDIQKILSPGMYELLIEIAKAGDADLVIQLLCELYPDNLTLEYVIPEFHQPFKELGITVEDLDLPLIKEQLPDWDEDKYNYQDISSDCLFEYLQCLRHKHSPNPGNRVIQIPNVLKDPHLENFYDLFAV